MFRVHVALPYCENTPTGRAQLPLRPPISDPISFDFRQPKPAIGLRGPTPCTGGVAMPEASMNTNHDSVFGENNIGNARKPAHVHAKAKSSSMEE